MAKEGLVFLGLTKLGNCLHPNHLWVLLDFRYSKFILNWLISWRNKERWRIFIKTWLSQLLIFLLWFFINFFREKDASWNFAVISWVYTSTIQHVHTGIALDNLGTSQVTGIFGMISCGSKRFLDHFMHFTRFKAFMITNIFRAILFVERDRNILFLAGFGWPIEWFFIGFLWFFAYISKNIDFKIWH